MKVPHKPNNFAEFRRELFLSLDKNTDSFFSRSLWDLAVKGLCGNKWSRVFFVRGFATHFFIFKEIAKLKKSVQIFLISIFLLLLIASLSSCRNEKSAIEVTTKEITSVLPKFRSAPSEGLEYELNTDDTYTVLGIGKCKDDNIYIPAEYDGKAVVAIAERAFYNCGDLISITFPDSIISVGNLAFDGCNKLVAVRIFNLKAWCNVAFADHVANPLLLAKKLYITSVSSESGKLETKIVKEVTIPEEITTVRKWVFEGCTSIQKLTVPEQVAIIESHAFWGCRGLVELSIENPLIAIEPNAFQSCSNIVRASVPTSATALFPKSNLESITINGGTDLEENAFANCEMLTRVVIASNIREIKRSTFSGCRLLESITLPDNLEIIGVSAFSDCKSLTKVNIPNSVKSIGNAAFSGCYGLSKVQLPEELSSIGNFVFEKCTSLNQIKIPSLVSRIGYGAFYNCINLVRIVLPSQIEKIDTNAFHGCYRLIEVQNLSSLPIRAGSSNYGEVGKFAKHIYSSGNSFLRFGNDGFLFYQNQAETYLVAYWGTQTNLVLPANYDGIAYSLNPYAFCGNEKITDITLPSNLTDIPTGVFFGCSKLENIILPTGIIAIGDSAFTGCSSLTSITLPENLEMIDEYAFANCSKLKSISIPLKITKIEKYTFSGCTSLRSISFGSNISIIESNAFTNSNALSRIIYEGTTDQWNAVNTHEDWINENLYIIVVCKNGTVEYGQLKK